MQSQNHIKQAYKSYMIASSGNYATAIHKFRQENRKEDGTRYNYKEAGEMMVQSITKDLVVAS